jgi:D-tyrosyl-tRNA(Tyr) deacylase
MRVIIQRVNFASVKINNHIHAEIQKGLLILLGIEIDDNIDDAEWLVKKSVCFGFFQMKMVK